MQVKNYPTNRFVCLCMALFGVAMASLFSLPGVARAQDEPFAPAQPATLVAPAGEGAPGAETLILPTVQDTYIVQARPDANYDAEPDLLVAHDISPTLLNTWTLLQWDLSSIPRGSIVHYAEMDLYQTAATTSTMAIGRVMTKWRSDNVTWETQPKATTYDPSWTPPAATGQYITRNITALVNNWVNSPAEVANLGLAIAPVSRRADKRIFDSASQEFGHEPLLIVRFQLPPIRVCHDYTYACSKPAVGAEVFNRTTGKTYVADERGYIPSGAVRLGDSLWARLADQAVPLATLYRTSGAPVKVDAGSFKDYTELNGREMRLAVGGRNFLLLYNLTVSAQWYLEDDPARVEWLRANLIRASDYLYDFSEGQFALGTVHVKQVYEGWDGANIKLHTSNTFHPNANVGGIVPSETPDVSPSIPISYAPGSIFIGSYWNRFGTPPNQVNTYKGQVVPPEVMVDDWAIALAHEFGHYLLFLFDTYTDKNGNSDDAIAALCTGSAMGNAYPLDNHAYVFAQQHWEENCGATEAFYRLNGRNEWDTIHAWYNWTVVPEIAVPGEFPPIQLTNVIFDAPAVLPTPLASQVFSLTYQAGETSSGEARAFLIRDDSLVFDQGKPAKNATVVQLTDARLGDRLCVYDINDHAEDGALPRHQFGCEVIAVGDSDLNLTRDTTWAPEVNIAQTATQQVSVTVHQAVTPADALLRARLVPEVGTALSTFNLTRNGDVWTGVFDLPEPVAPLYLQVWVDETPATPQTRREAMADRGTGGTGAFGPARLHSGVMAISSDGNASYSSDTPLNLADGESIAWQSMPGTPPLPPWKQISGQAYRLDAFPPSLVAGGTVGIRFADSDTLSAAAMAAPTPAIHFWDGSAWRPLPTTISTPAGTGDSPAGALDGILLASAPSQGVGVYAVLRDSTPAMFLPFVNR